MYLWATLKIAEIKLCGRKQLSTQHHLDPIKMLDELRSEFVSRNCNDFQQRVQRRRSCKIQSCFLLPVKRRLRPCSALYWGLFFHRYHTHPVWRWAAAWQCWCRLRWGPCRLVPAAGGCARARRAAAPAPASPPPTPAPASTPRCAPDTAGGTRAPAEAKHRGSNTPTPDWWVSSQETRRNAGVLTDIGKSFQERLRIAVYFQRS